MGNVAQMESLAPSSSLDRGVMRGAEVKARLDAILDIAAHAMVENIDFGKVPGTDKPSLWQAGADKLSVAFQIAPTVREVLAIGDGDEKAYRVIVQGIHQPTGIVLGEGTGECSSNEEKYAFRYAVHENEWTATPEDRRRLKYKRDGSTIKQVRTNPADVANTVLKMATKRAKIAMVLAVTGAAAIFTQDVEDLAEELRDAIAHEGDEKKRPAPPQRKSQQQSSSRQQSKPADGPSQATGPVNIGKVEQPNGKKFYRIEVVGDARYFTVWPGAGPGDDAIVAAKKFSGEDAKAIVSFVEKTAGDKSYFNVTGVTPAPVEEAKTEREPGSDDGDEPITADDIFGGRK
jgi:hypothetical protein